MGTSMGTDKDQIERRLHTSAMVDGETTPQEAQAWLQAWGQDERSRQDWHTYHLIGDVLRSEELARTAEHDHALLKKVQDALAQEPVVLAPGRTPPARPRPRHRLWAASAAVVSGFMLVGGAVLFSRVDSGAVMGGWGQDLLAQLQLPAASSFSAGPDDLRRASVNLGSPTAMPMAGASMVGASVVGAPNSPNAAFREILRLPHGPAGQPMQSVQVLYSNGSATISVQVEPFRPGQHVPKSEPGERLNALSLQRDGVWLTLRGDVPLETLSQFAAVVQVAP